jgi:hypothetical protein
MKRMLPLLLATVVTTLPIASPSPSPVPDPCAHRLFCGKIRFVPQNADERRAFFANAEASLIDGIVTAHYVRGNPVNEADPIVRPFVRNGLPSLALGWGLIEIGQRSAMRAFHLNESRADDFTLGGHVSGVASWLSPRTYSWGVSPKLIYSNPYVQQRWIMYDAMPASY